MPLSEQALAVLENMKSLSHGGDGEDEANVLVFPGEGVAAPLAIGQC